MIHPDAKDNLAAVQQFGANVPLVNMGSKTLRQQHGQHASPRLSDVDDQGTRSRLPQGPDSLPEQIRLPGSKPRQCLQALREPRSSGGRPTASRRWEPRAQDRDAHSHGTGAGRGALAAARGTNNSRLAGLPQGHLVHATKPLVMASTQRILVPQWRASDPVGGP